MLTAYNLQVLQRKVTKLAAYVEDSASSGTRAQKAVTFAANIDTWVTGKLKDLARSHSLTIQQMVSSNDIVDLELRKAQTYPDGWNIFLRKPHGTLSFSVTNPAGYTFSSSGENKNLSTGEEKSLNYLKNLLNQDILNTPTQCQMLLLCNIQNTIATIWRKLDFEVNVVSATKAGIQYTFNKEKHVFDCVFHQITALQQLSEMKHGDTEKFYALLVPEIIKFCTTARNQTQHEQCWINHYIDATASALIV